MTALLPLRIAFLGNFSVPYSTESHLAASLEELGHQVRRLQEGDRRWADMAKLTAGADVFWWVQTLSLASRDPIDARREGIDALNAVMPTVATHLDLWWGLSRQHQISEEPFFRCAWVFTADGDHDAEWAAAGVRHHWFPPGCLRSECRPGVPRDEYRTDVCFVGSWERYGHDEWWPARQALLDRARSQFGHGFACWPSPGRGAVRGMDLNDLFASVGAVLGDSCMADRSNRYVSDRYFETCGRGGPLVAPLIPGVAELLRPEEHALYFPPGDLDAAMFHVEHLLAHPAEARAMAARAQRHVRDQHSYLHRCERVLDVLAEEGAL